MIGNYHRTANKILDYALYIAGVNTNETIFLPHAKRFEIVKHMIAEAQNKDASVTYRKGKRGGWRDEFTPSVLDAFKKNDPGWLVELGYEKGKQWQ
jgi:hypothetical protein